MKKEEFEYIYMDNDKWKNKNRINKLCYQLNGFY